MHLSNRAVIWRAAIFVAFIVALIIVGVTVPLPSVDQIRAAAADAGWLGAVVFVVGYGLVTLTPIPKNVVSIAAGLTWGLGLGVLLVYVGALIGAGLAFAIGRGLGRAAVERFTGVRVARVDEVLRRRGLITLIGVRLVPILPFTVINYTAGLTAVRRRDYAIGTIVGILPGTIAYVAVGAYGTTLGWPFYLAAGG
ncbi:MAG: TVP38/TMEM64 family protein, partial [Rhodoglobus sp.]|nr:TVP38/TMEM64 family protein [Rhodoglobus sp.]